MRWGRKIEPAILSIIYIDDTRRRYSGEHGECEEEQNEEMAARFECSPRQPDAGSTDVFGGTRRIRRIM